MEVYWSRQALADRQAIFLYLSTQSVIAGDLVDDRIQADVDLLAAYPEAGRPGRVIRTRELVVRRTPYIVVYIADMDDVRILRVLHAAQRWPEFFPKSG